MVKRKQTEYIQGHATHQRTEGDYMTKITAKQEAFCLAIVSGMNQSDAYRKAYAASNMLPATVQNKAHVLAKNGEIAARVAALRKPAVEAAQITLKNHLDRLKHLSELAETEKQYSAAIAAEFNRGKASGHYVDRHEDVSDPFKKAIAGMSVEKAQSIMDAMDQLDAIQAKAAAN